MRYLIASLMVLLAHFGLHADETEVRWYGYFKFDMAHDSAVSSNGNYVLYVRPQPRGHETSTLSITARQTRVGADVRRGAMRGKIEVDFYGASPENKNALLVRQGHITVPLGALSVEAGQATDLIASLAPSTLNYSVVYGAGNVGYRRPQLKVYYRGDVLFGGISLARNLSADLDGDTVVDGEASGVPAVQGRVACTLRPGSAEATLGLWSHYGRCNCPAEGESYSNWSVGGDGRLALGPRLALLGEWYTGANMGQYGGAIYNSDQLGGLHSTGGWVNIQYR
ncbi:MAG: DcaP family trimeric outer membrane transporter, partial [Candidatus Latescibacteria bacterium]|nr:DcaP family trimeric outer membrane transporter [Candidatus Latescibacterota bacterium]